jgi:hypothetical protein
MTFCVSLCRNIPLEKGGLRGIFHNFKSPLPPFAKGGIAYFMHCVITTVNEVNFVAYRGFTV